MTDLEIARTTLSSSHRGAHSGYWQAQVDSVFAAIFGRQYLPFLHELT
jgi:hypothetical protein